MIKRNLDEGKTAGQVDRRPDTARITEMVFSGSWGPASVQSQPFTPQSQCVHTIAHTDFTGNTSRRRRGPGGSRKNSEAVRRNHGNGKFKALVVRERDDKSFARAIEERAIDDLPRAVSSWTCATPRSITRTCSRPRGTRRHEELSAYAGHRRGGVVVSCADGAFKPGDEVIVTSYDLGKNTSGGYGRRIRVPSAWALPLRWGCRFARRWCRHRGPYGRPFSAPPA